jgi:hypothetical protein
MWRYLVGLMAGMLLFAGGVLWWRNTADAGQSLPAAPAPTAGTATDEPMPAAPQASAKTREERRFGRYDHDKDGAVTRDEYLASRRKAFAKLDKDGDGRLSFEEYAVKGIDRFAKADADGSGTLIPSEFLTTRIERKTTSVRHCPPPVAGGDD